MADDPFIEKTRRDGGGRRTFALRPEFRRKMEDAFGEGFSDVAVRRSGAVDASLGGVAATVGRDVLIGGGFARLPAGARERVLAHELAHVVQKRRSAAADPRSSRDPRYRARLEAEADQAAIEAVRGRRAVCRLPDIASAPSAWGPAGHYWTCYFVMLAAGVDEEEAQQRAFFCQMPDQVREFDATCAGVDWAEGILDIQRGTPVGSFYPSTDPAGVPTHDVTYMTYYHRLEPAPETNDQKMDRLVVDLEISQGLHSLTGDNAAEEVAFRKKQLMSFKTDPLIYGLALHAYGDSYAHQDLNNTGRMYHPIVGHAQEWLRPSNAKATTGAYFSRLPDAAHEPDDIANPMPGRESLYLQYVENLYQIVSETLQTNPNLRIIREPVHRNDINDRCRLEVRAILQELTAMEFVHQVNKRNDDDKQSLESETIMKLALKYLKYRAPKFPYHPQDEDEQYWRGFWPSHSEFIGNAIEAQVMFDRVRAIGARWSAAR